MLQRLPRYLAVSRYLESVATRSCRLEISSTYHRQPDYYHRANQTTYHPKFDRILMACSLSSLVAAPLVGPASGVGTWEGVDTRLHSANQTGGEIMGSCTLLRLIYGNTYVCIQDLVECSVRSQGAGYSKI